jgi:hypothetical protein
MTKTKARQRAKAKAAEKAAKRLAGGEQAAKGHPDHFDPGTRTIRSPAANLGGRGFGGVRRGASRSR